MNIRQQLTEAKTQNKTLALEIAAFAISSKTGFQQLMDCFLADDYRLAQRAAWCVSWAVKKQPAVIQPFLPQLVAQLKRTDKHPAVTRNAARILEAVDIPEELHGEVMDACFTLVETPGTAVAIKAFCLTTLFKLTKQYPEIKPELKLIINAVMENETSAFKVRARKMLPYL